MSDYISRTKAIEEINKYHMTSGVTNQGTWNECVDVIAHTVAELPSADAISIDQANAMIKSYISHYEENKGEWIPVSERLPKDEEDVLVYCEYGGMRIAYYHHDYTFYSIGFKDLNETGWYDENDDAMYPEPIAWQPLPKLYKADMRGET